MKIFLGMAGVIFIGLLLLLIRKIFSVVMTPNKSQNHYIALIILLAVGLFTSYVMFSMARKVILFYSKE